MNDVVPFRFEDGQVRVIDRDGQLWFVLADVCRVLDIANASQAAARLDDDEKGIISAYTPSGDQQMIIVNETGLWSLVLTSRKREAKRFKKWITSEVIPSIRKTGAYGAPAPALNLNDPATLHRLLLDHTGRAMALEARASELEPKAAALEKLTAAEGALCITDAAKALHVAPRSLFNRLERESWIYRRPGGGHWIGYQQRIAAGLITHRVARIERSSGPRFVEQVLITPRGLAKLAERIVSPAGAA